jgi:hypothetical protein
MGGTILNAPGGASEETPTSLLCSKRWLPLGRISPTHWTAKHINNTEHYYKWAHSPSSSSTSSIDMGYHTATSSLHSKRWLLLCRRSPTHWTATKHINKTKHYYSRANPPSSSSTSSINMGYHTGGVAESKASTSEGWLASTESRMGACSTDGKGDWWTVGWGSEDKLQVLWI